jgi:hypothetical protein
VIVSRRIAGLRLNHVFTFDGREGRPLVTRFGRSGRSMTVHVAKVAGRPIGNPPELDQRRTP